jgi:hypothetical protein
LNKSSNASSLSSFDKEFKIRVTLSPEIENKKLIHATLKRYKSFIYIIWMSQLNALLLTLSEYNKLFQSNKIK